MQNQRFVVITFRQTLSFILLAGVLCSAFSVQAQTRRGAVVRTTKTSAAKPKPATPPREQSGNNQNKTCNGGWSGVVTFEKRLKDSSDKTEKNITSGTTRNVTSRDYNYAGRFFVDGSKAPVVQTRTQFSLTDKDDKFQRSVQNDTCFYDGKGSREQWVENVQKRVTSGFGEGEGDFSMNVDQQNGTYSFSFRFPEGKGTDTRESKVTAGGWCQPDNNKPSQYNSNLPERIDREGAQIQDQKIDPDNPDVLSGSKTWDTSGKTVKSFVYTVTWSFKRCPAELEILDVEFAEHPYPDFETWRKIEDEETVDSNLVRIRAKIVNYSSETKFPKIEFKELKENITLENGETSISIAPGEIREVDYLWDTSGFAWVMGGRPLSRRQIKVEVTEKQTRQMTKEIVITPRPVVLAHGLWADHTAWDGYDKFFYKAHSSIWRTFAVGKDPSNGRMNTGEKGTWKPSKSIIDNATELAKQIEFVQKEMNAWHLDVVAHSMGGIIARSYIHDRMRIEPDGKPTIQHLVMLGTPNMGSPCANLMGFTFWSLGKPVESLNQLTPIYMHGFNRAVRNRKGVKFSNLVGTSVPATCQSWFPGDGVVEIPSAVWDIEHVRYSKSIHTSLTSEEDFWRLVWRRLSVSRLGNHKPDPKQYHAQTSDFNRRSENPVRFLSASFGAGSEERQDKFAAPENTKINLTKEVALEPRQTIELDIPGVVDIPGSSAVTFMAHPDVAATLTDEKGAVVGKSAANSAEAAADFRTISIDKSAAGNLKLKLENTGATKTSVVVAAWTNTSQNRISFTLTTGKPNTGQFPITAKLFENDAPVINATIKARIKSEDGKQTEIILRDDGNAGDGAGGDGVYGSLSEKLASGEYSIEAVADIRGQMHLAATSLSAGAETKTAVKPAAKTVKK
ncbi:MAG TPA: choice-of-anchor X domain-containing protein [Pyrinomonadaceae bacterium]|jgi:pimeloyl-ACP methyl ester carboxylesterase